MKRLSRAALVAAFVVPGAALAQAPDADRWNLGDIYADQAAWDADASRLEKTDLPALAACKGQLGRSAQRLRECMDAGAEAEKRLSRLGAYAYEKLSEDTSVAASQSLMQRAQLLQNKLQETTAYAEPELLAVGEKKIDAFLKADPKLRVYAFPLKKTLRSAAHTLDEKGEALLAQMGLVRGSAQDAYGMLVEADMPWPKVKLSTGEEITLDQSAYGKYRALPDRGDRERVMTAFFATYKQFERTIGATLYAQMKEDAAFAKARRYPDSVSAALDGNRTPVAVMDTLIAQANAGLPTLHRYFKLRARMLGVPQMAYHDIYPPLVKSDIKFPLSVGKQLAVASAAPLGDDYVAVLKKGLDSRWMDAYPRPRKRSGAHMVGSAYDVHPYVLMNYTDDYSSVSTLAHEWGHAMHSWQANKTQPFVTAGYPIFTAEIASTFNEALLLDHVLKNAKNDEERLLYLGSALEELRGTFFRQTMFAEFERTTHARVDKGEPMTGADYTKAYCDVLKRYHGTEQGVVKIDDGICMEWAYIPHFYRSYYVYQYATSTAAAALFAEQVTKGVPGARDKYLGLLRAGGSEDPYVLVKNAGVDLATPAPYQAAVARMNRIMDEIEVILAKRGG